MRIVMMNRVGLVLWCQAKKWLRIQALVLQLVVWNGTDLAIVVRTCLISWLICKVTRKKGTKMAEQGRRKKRRVAVEVVRMMILWLFSRILMMSP